MKMKCASIPGAEKGSPHAVTEVEVSGVVYRINPSSCTEREAKSGCFAELLGRDLRIILTEEAHYNRDPEYVIVTPADVETVLFYGVKRKFLFEAANVH